LALRCSEGFRGRSDRRGSEVADHHGGRVEEREAGVFLVEFLNETSVDLWSLARDLSSEIEKHQDFLIHFSIRAQRVARRSGGYRRRQYIDRPEC